jgi:cobalt-zinc-cadmium efflux system outer membrane protein
MKNYIILAILFFSIGKIIGQDFLTLKKTLQIAKENHPLLKLEKYKIEMAETDIISAKLRPNIILNNQSLFSINNKFFPENTGYFGASNRQIWWQMTKIFQLPSIRNTKIALAKQNKILSQKNYEEIERNLLLEVALQWSEVLTNKQTLDLIQISKKNVDSLVRINQLRLKNQVITETDLLRTELLSNQYQIEERLAQQKYLNTLKRLKFLMNKNEKDTLLIDFSENSLPTFYNNLDSLLNNSLQQRTDIRLAKSNIDFAEKNIKSQKALAWTSPELGLIYNPQNTIPYLGIYATYEIPIFSRNQGEIQKSIIYKSQAEENLKILEKQINVEILTTFQTFQTHQKNLEKYQSILEKAQKILDNVRYAYLRGGTTIIDFLEAQRSWADTQEKYFNILKDFRESYIRLLYVSGKINELSGE